MQKAYLICLLSLLILPFITIPLSSAQNNPKGEYLLFHTESLSSRHFVYQRLHRGLPVFDGDRRVHVDLETDVAVEEISGVDPPFSEVGNGDGYYRGRLVRRYVVEDSYGRPSIVYQAVHTGEIWIEQQWYDAAASQSGEARVFIPNPIVATGNYDLRDEENSASAVPNAAYSTVPLFNLDGTGYLDGMFGNNKLLCKSANIHCDNRFFSPSLVFTQVERSMTPKFEEAMVYWAVDASTRYIHSLNFERVMYYSIPAYPYHSIDHNAWFTLTKPGEGELYFGTGGTDAAEDADVIWHEYGHAVLASQGITKQNGQGFGEGFADWWTAVMSIKVSAPLTAAPCVAEWFAVEMSPTEKMGGCLRTLANDFHYPEDVVGIEVHYAGLTIGGALWDATRVIDLDRLVTIVLEGNFFLSREPTQPEAAYKYVQAARWLAYTEEASTLEKIFQIRGLL